MPIYDFHCRACGHDFEALVRPQDLEPPRCPSCQAVDLERQLSTFAVSTAERRQAAVKQSRQRQIKANKEKLVADEEYRKEHEGH
jgi:putative FmdB family regulatory protein